MVRAEQVQRLVEAGVIPIVRVGSEETALRVSEALLAGGVRTVEVTFTVPGASRVIAALRERYPELLVGAGTVLDAASAREAVAAGAHYLLSVGLVREVVETAHRYGLPAIPGVLTPTEALRGLELGADVLKLFPASLVGPSYLKALTAPLPQASWCPTGGVDLENLAEWARAGADLVGVGGPLLQDVAQTGDFQALTARAHRFVSGWNEAVAATREGASR
ncbi:bifunctional 4-hydroxy-2-oxoglutarate aldolase/2-dehydro-3-deoxy-phosphogluconate aldolase [Limnochorda pilosa]|uniref:2-dehydro-3-deoxyphosphogluconate aldolase/4-hydroxy-2-oxoglutarate aldolase n=1 Tax=Limnochorda pilosa TaxID=1555112 RepID=A0A0K2SLH3_LIMPI|nr:bifunctional 4-hydroxy-2-oxoglutarate aldolase/2-dehydro-3-deoxy-phosphogluconate aldolase [Limnochorda pilosa]BAS27857.1 2-dehydro-3-deoxyphosphogluconate aldolase/4-hydroxy-2-oxoglutarate aldolase [Limnochorda pilosa]